MPGRLPGPPPAPVITRCKNSPVPHAGRLGGKAVSGGSAKIAPRWATASAHHRLGGRPALPRPSLPACPRLQWDFGLSTSSSWQPMLCGSARAYPLPKGVGMGTPSTGAGCLPGALLRPWGPGGPGGPGFGFCGAVPGAGDASLEAEDLRACSSRGAGLRRAGWASTGGSRTCPGEASGSSRCGSLPSPPSCQRLLAGALGYWPRWIA